MISFHSIIHNLAGAMLTANKVKLLTHDTRSKNMYAFYRTYVLQVICFIVKKLVHRRPN